jgi:hypothetical protein
MNSQIDGASYLREAPYFGLYNIRIQNQMSNSKAFILGCIFVANTISDVTAAASVPLGTASKFVILTKAGISTVPPSVIKGNIGVSPIAATAMTGFSLTADSSNSFSTSDQITGRAYGANYASPTPSDMTTAVLDMETAYTDAAGRSISSASNLNLMSGLISGVTFKPGVYNWKSDVMFSSDIYLKGSSEDIFIFQSIGNIIAGSGAKIILVDGGGDGGKPKASNVFWVSAGYLSAGTTAHLEGIFLVKTHSVLKTGSSLYGRILSQTACTLDSATIVDPTIENKADAIMKEPSTVDGANMNDSPIEMKPPGSEDKMKNPPIEMKPPGSEDKMKNPPI